MANQISQNRSRNKTGYDLMDRYSNPLSVLRRSSKYRVLLSQAEPVARRLEAEIEVSGRAYVQMDSDWAILNSLCTALSKDACSGKTIGDVPVYGQALSALSKKYPDSLAHFISMYGVKEGSVKS